MAREFNVLALIKGQERYIFVYDDDSRQPLIEAFRDQAADPQLTFSWFDAAVLTEKARQQADSERRGSSPPSEMYRRDQTGGSPGPGGRPRFET